MEKKGYPFTRYKVTGSKRTGKKEKKERGLSPI